MTDAVPVSALGGNSKDIEERLAQRGDLCERRLVEQAPALGLSQFVELCEQSRDQRCNAVALKQADEKLVADHRSKEAGRINQRRLALVERAGDLDLDRRRSQPLRELGESNGVIMERARRRLAAHPGVASTTNDPRGLDDDLARAKHVLSFRGGGDRSKGGAAAGAVPGDFGTRRQVAAFDLLVGERNAAEPGGISGRVDSSAHSDGGGGCERGQVAGQFDDGVMRLRLVGLGDVRVLDGGDRLTGVVNVEPGVAKPGPFGLEALEQLRRAAERLRQRRGQRRVDGVGRLEEKPAVGKGRVGRQLRQLAGFERKRSGDAGERSQRRRGSRDIG